MIRTSVTMSGDIIIIDTDAGADDAMAIYYLLSSPLGKCVKGITTVKGNADLPDVVNNVLKVLGTTNFKVPVHLGKDEGLSGKKQSDGYFGKDGLGDFEYKGEMDKSLVQEKDGISFLTETVKENPGKVTVACLAPLTNIAAAGKKCDKFFHLVKSLVIIGGQLNEQEVGKEFNLLMDPVAASYIFECISTPNKVKLIPKESFLKLPLDFRNEKIRAIDSDIVRFFNNSERIQLTKKPFWFVADQIAVILMVHPQAVISSELRKVSISQNGHLTVTEGTTTEIIKLIDIDFVKNTLLACINK